MSAFGPKQTSASALHMSAFGSKAASRFASITRAGIRREVLKFIRLAFPLLRVSRGSPFDRDIRPSFRIFCVKLQPPLSARFSIRLDRFYRAFRLAHAAIDAFVRMDDEHVLTLVETIDGADLYAVHQFALDATLVDDVGQLISFQQIAALKSPTMFAIAVLALWLKVNAEKIRVLWLYRNSEQCAFRC